MISISKVVLLTAMEFLRDENINRAESVTETPKDESNYVDSGADTESIHGVELEDWPDHQARNNKKKSGQQLGWLHVIGEDREYVRHF